jgi:hypothetical protein
MGQLESRRSGTGVDRARVKVNSYSTACLVAAALLGVFSGSAGAQESKSSTEGRITSEMIGRRHGPMALKKSATDPQYGTSEKHPIVVGGGLGAGVRNTYRFLNALRGPKGELVHYDRAGSCCAFTTTKAVIGDRGLLDVYNVWYDGQQPVRMYFNWYDDGDPLVPVGFTAAK